MQQDGRQGPVHGTAEHTEPHYGHDWLAKHHHTDNIVGSTLAFCLLYWIVNHSLQRFWPEVFKEEDGLRWRTAERINGIVHATTTVILSSLGLLHGWASTTAAVSALSPLGFEYDAPNSPLLELSLSITIAYFVVDLVAMWANAIRSDAPDLPLSFTLHHFACATVTLFALTTTIT